MVFNFVYHIRNIHYNEWARNSGLTTICMNTGSFQTLEHNLDILSEVAWHSEKLKCDKLRRLYMYTAIANVYLLSGMFNVYSLDCCCFWSNKKHFVFSFAQTMLKSYTLCIHFRTILHIILTKCSQLIAIIINSKKMRMCRGVCVIAQYF